VRAALPVKLRPDRTSRVAGQPYKKKGTLRAGKTKCLPGCVWVAESLRALGQGLKWFNRRALAAWSRPTFLSEFCPRTVACKTQPVPRESAETAWFRWISLGLFSPCRGLRVIRNQALPDPIPASLPKSVIPRLTAASRERVIYQR
jgi:hypothetical protein